MGNYDKKRSASATPVHKDVAGDETIGGQSINPITKDSSGNLLLGTCTTIPSNGQAGFAKGCVLIDTDVAGGTASFYVNNGTTSSCTFEVAGASVPSGSISGDEASNTLNTRVAGMQIGGFNATEQKYVFIVPFNDCYIDTFNLLSDTASSGSDGSNNYAFQLRNLTQGEDLLATAVNTNGNEIAADTPYQITPDQNNTALPVGDVIELQITKTGTATDLSSAEVYAQVGYSSPS